MRNGVHAPAIPRHFIDADCTAEVSTTSLVSSVVGDPPFAAESLNRRMHGGGRSRFDDYALVRPRPKRVCRRGVLHARLIVGFHAGCHSRPGFATVVHVVVGVSFTEHPCRLKEAFGPVGISAAVVAQGQRRVHLARIVAAKHVFAGIVVGYVGERVGVTHIVDFRRSVRRSVHGFHGNI